MLAAVLAAKNMKEQRNRHPVLWVRDPILFYMQCQTSYCGVRKISGCIITAMHGENREEWRNWTKCQATGVPQTDFR